MRISRTRSADPAASDSKLASGISVLTQPDIRWGRRDIKTTQLLPNLLAKTAAKRAGAGEAWLVDDEGFVTEGSATNAWIVTAAFVVLSLIGTEKPNACPEFQWDGSEGAEIAPRLREFTESFPRNAVGDVCAAEYGTFLDGVVPQIVQACQNYVLP